MFYFRTWNINFVFLTCIWFCTTPANGDFEGKEETLTLSAGDAVSAPFVVGITDDSIAECTEDFDISVNIVPTSVKQGAVVKIIEDAANVVVSDNDGEICGDLRAYKSIMNK